MKIIGITGLMGSGKSTVAGMLADLGASVINADEIAHAIYAPGTNGIKRVEEAFGHAVIAPDGSVDRQALGQVVFRDDSARETLNRITHPLIAAEIKRLLARNRRQNVEVTVVEAALLIEAGWLRMMDEIWLTVAPRQVIYLRLGNSLHLSPDEVKLRLRTQLPVSKQLRYATLTVSTDTSLEKLRAKVGRLWKSEVLPAAY